MQGGEESLATVTTTNKTYGNEHFSSLNTLISSPMTDSDET